VSVADEHEEPAVSPPTPDVLTVSRLNREARAILEGSFPLLWVEGEISNLSRPASGHWYFSLKDDAAQVRAAMFRNRNMYLGFTPANGMHVLVRAQVSLYENRGEFQLIVEHMEEAGDGALRRAFEALKQRLAAEGLFNAQRKRPLPLVPRRIGVVTSQYGAALRDVLSVLRRRAPSIPVLIYPVPVQGSGAAREIISALRLASRRRDCDVLILARGGGSLEDLAAFNDELVARAIAESTVPVVSGVGHETDFTIADFVADVRAPTPSAAAETVSPSRTEWLHRLRQYQHRLTRTLSLHLDKERRTLQWLRARLQHPEQKLRARAQRLDDFERRLRNAQRHGVREAAHQLRTCREKLLQQSPHARLLERLQRTEILSYRLQARLRQRLDQSQQHLADMARALETVNPLATLARGYAIVCRAPDGKLVTSSDQVAVGDRADVRLARGRLICTVNETIKEPSNS
jgi:exodeoxyribonuclease VII large subunit